MDLNRGRNPAAIHLDTPNVTTWPRLIVDPGMTVAMEVEHGFTKPFEPSEQGLKEIVMRGFGLRVSEQDQVGDGGFMPIELQLRPGEILGMPPPPFVLVVNSAAHQVDPNKQGSLQDEREVLRSASISLDLPVVVELPVEVQQVFAPMLPGGVRIRTVIPFVIARNHKQWPWGLLQNVGHFEIDRFIAGHGPTFDIAEMHSEAACSGQSAYVRGEQQVLVENVGYIPHGAERQP